MFIIKLALLTCAFYLIICVVLELALFAAGYFGWIGMVMVKGWLPSCLIFGTVWLISFYCAGRLSMIFLGRIP